MCDCVPDNFRPGSRCKRKFYTGCGRKNFFNINLESTIIHFWLYMVFIGIIIGFVLKTVGCYFEGRNCKGCKNESFRKDSEEEEEEEIEEVGIEEEEEEVVEKEEEESTPPTPEPEPEAEPVDDDQCSVPEDKEC